MDEARESYLIFGGAGGIGSLLSSRLALTGKTVYIVGRRSEPLAAVAQATGAVAISADATELEQVERVYERIKTDGATLTGVVNLVGSILLKPLHLTSSADWEETLRVNLTSAFNVSRCAVKAMLASSTPGAIVLMSSAAARIGLANHEAIASAKSAIEGLALATAASYAGKGIRVNCVAPGLVRTPLSARVLSNPAGEQASTQLHPLGRLGQPEDIANMIEFLLSPENSWITGQVFAVDGGLSRLKVRNG